MATPTALPASFTAGDVLTAANMNLLRGGFRILQVVSTTKTDTFTTNAATFTDVTGLSATITPRESSSKVLVIAHITGSNDYAVVVGGWRLVRDSTAICVGDTAGSRISGNQVEAINGSVLMTQANIVLDSPATTSAITYKVQVRSQTTGNFYINRSKTDTDNSSFFRGASTITLLEVSA